MAEDFGALHQTIIDSLLSTTRATSQVCAEDLAFQRSLDPGVAAALDREHARLLALAERLLGNAAAGTDLVNPKLADADALDAKWRGVVDVVDSLLERADMCLDEFHGVIKRGNAGREQQSPLVDPVSRISKVPKNLDIVKPQLSFEHVPKNDEKEAFKPLLTWKPHAIIPLEQSLRQGEQNWQTRTAQYDHPYRTEIQHYSYPKSVYSVAEPIPYHPFETTTATYVDTPKAVMEMLAELKGASEIAIDLEHHDTRSYAGIVCLMQISTRDRDWIVDTLKPWRRLLECLNEVFTDPKIVKVFHGSQSDIVWLQRDFGLYIVGLFDTHHASRVLSYKGGSLAFLLEKFVSFQAQKQYQMADWRIRPIPQEMLDYARSDTHFLLYIYDNMRNELVDSSKFQGVEQNPVLEVLSLSKATSLLRFEHSMYDSERGMGNLGWYKQLSRTPALFTKEQFAIFRAVHQWRDNVARQEDESINYIMTTHALFNVAREMPLDRVAMFSVAAPISQPVRLRIDELVGVVGKARGEGPMGPEMHAIMTEIDNFVISKKADTVSSSTITTTTIDKPSSFSKEESRKANASPTVAPVVNRVTEPLTVSNLWGSVFGSSFWQAKDKKRDDIRLELPLPALTAEIYETDGMQLDNGPGLHANNKSAPVQVAAAAERPEHEYVKGDARGPAQDGLDDVFVVRQLGGKRKRKRATAALMGADAGVGAQNLAHTEANTLLPGRFGPAAEEDQLGAQADMVDIGVMDADGPSDKARRKAEKRAKKKAKKDKAERRAKEGKAGTGEVNNDLHGPSNGDGEVQEEEEVFDYEAAPSMLNAPRDHKELRKRGRKYDPYARALDAPKGLGRTQREKGGRSATFKK